jgi:lysyl-tRNA synthetase, class I
MTENQTSNYWLDIAAKEISEHYPDGEIVISSGISPSASYHIGHFREIMTADALAWGLKRLGRKVRHIHVVDDFDPLRRRYDFLPERFEEFVGQPICLIPDPEGDCHDTYADHFYKEFEAYARQMGIVPDEIIHSYSDLYASGKMTKSFEKVLENIPLIRDIFERKSNRRLPDDWTPVQVMDETNRFSNAPVTSWDKDSKKVGGQDYTSGRAKLNWRLDWPARWGILGVMVEPFSAQEHGAAGGSYDTGVEFARQVYGIEPPIPGVQYANIHLIGETKKMSSSKGNLITPKQALEIMPPEVLRFFVVRSKPDRTLYFDPGLGLYNLMDEYAKITTELAEGGTSEFKEAHQFAAAVNDGEAAVTAVPFSHLVSVYQAARGDLGRAKELLRRTGYAGEADSKPLERELGFVANWLKQYAPQQVKFSVQDELPEVNLSDEQKDFLLKLADSVEEAENLDGQKMHDLIYAAKDEAGLRPIEAFQAIYQVILGQNSGPKAGWFLAELDKDWLVKRLRLKV